MEATLRSLPDPEFQQSSFCLMYFFKRLRRFKIISVKRYQAGAGPGAIQLMPDLAEVVVIERAGQLYLII